MNLASKNLFWSLLNLVLIIGLIFGARVLIFGSYLPPSGRTITVSGDGKVTVTPDIAMISFSVVTQGKEPETIQEENTEKMNEVISFIKEQGIEPKDIKTSNYNLYPQYDYGRRPDIYPPPPPKIIGYTLTQTVQVKVRDLGKVAPILGGLPERGINQIDTVSFDVEDPDEYLNQAREEAFKKARDKADAMAKFNGTRVRRVVTFSESFGGYPIPFLRAEALGKGGDLGGELPPVIEPGSQEMTVNVSVTYEIR